MGIIGTLKKRAINRIHKLNRRQLKRHAPEELQHNILVKLLQTARNTAFGKEHHFEEILESDNIPKSFAEHVPIRTYDEMWEWWGRSYHYVEPNVFWPGRPKYFALSSGTSGKPVKRIPVSEQMIKSIRRAGIKQFLAQSNCDLPAGYYDRKTLLFGASSRLHSNGHSYEGYISGISIKESPPWFSMLTEPSRKILEEDWDAKLRKIIEKAPEWDIGSICGLPNWVQLLCERIIEHYHVNTIHDIWPNLAIFVHGGVPFHTYRANFDAMLKRPIAYLGVYSASEGYFAYQEYPDGDMRLIVDNRVYYEFIPFNGENFHPDGTLKDEHQALDITQVQDGMEYALVITTCSGTWRYLIEDVIEFTSVEKMEIKVVGRTQGFLNICSEHVSEENMNYAIKAVGERFGFNIKEYTSIGRNYNDNEFAHYWYIGCDNPTVDPNAVRDYLDETLQNINFYYRDERVLLLKHIIVELLPNKRFYDWLAQKGKVGNQHKFPRLLKDKDFEEWNAFIKEKSVQN